VAAIIEEDGRFLLVEEQTPEGLRLNNPAGHLEPGETPEQGVVRETLEETARTFEPEALVGVYLSRFVRPATGEDVTYLRLAYRGRVGAPIDGRALDHGIVRTLWLSADEIRAERARHRSPLVMRCIDDHLAGRAWPLDVVGIDGSLVEPEIKQREAQAQAHDDGSGGEPASARPEALAGSAPHAGAPAQPAGAAASAVTPKAAEPTLAQTAAALAERFPALFAPGAPKPIKLRIQADIQQRAPGVFTRRQLALFLHRHTTSTAYLRALVASGERFDLDGASAGVVADEHREAAAAEVERRRQISEQRRAGERAARRDVPRAQRRAPPGSGDAAAQCAATATATVDGAVLGVPLPPSIGADGAAGTHAGPATRARHADAPRDGRGHDDARHHARGRSDGRSRGPAAVRPSTGMSSSPASQASQPPRSPRSPPPRSPRQPAPQTDAARQGPAPRDDDVKGAEPLPDDPARRERALLLRSFEGSPLTPANFCALKGLGLAEFEAQMELARRERAERRKAAPRG